MNYNITLPNRDGTPGQETMQTENNISSFAVRFPA